MTSNDKTRQTLPTTAKGSALVLTVVLTSLLAMVAVLFVLLARMDRLGANASLRSKQLDMAVHSVLERIGYELVQDMPGMDPNGEYYDAPDPNDPWLASLEPYEVDNRYYWQQLSSLEGSQEGNRDVLIDKTNAYIQDYPETISDGNLADADGDGIADSRWFEVPNLQTERGEPVYAALRILDHGSMLNVNTGYDFNELRFHPEARQMQVDLSYLSRREDPNWTDEPNGFDALNEFRGGDFEDWSAYQDDVVKDYDLPRSSYHPFDISDELKLRYRFVLNDLGADGITTRIGDLWTDTFFGGPQVRVSKIGSQNYLFSEWGEIATYQKDPDSGRKDYDYRHIATTTSTDRLTARWGNLQADLNQDSAQDIYDRMVEATDPNDGDRVRLAQLAANVYAFLHPTDSEPSQVEPDETDPNDRVYGLMPQPFISEIACCLDLNNLSDPNSNLFAVELANPFGYPVDCNGLALVLEYYDANTTQTIDLSEIGDLAPYGYKVVANRSINDVNVDAVNAQLILGSWNSNTMGDVQDWTTLHLVRTLSNGDELVLDRQEVFANWLGDEVMVDAGDLVSLYRFDGMGSGDSTTRQQNRYSVAYVPSVDPGEDPNGCATTDEPTLGRANSSDAVGDWNLALREDYESGGVLALGTPVELLRMLIVGPSTDRDVMTVGERLASEESEEADLFLDLVNRHYVLRNLFQGVTVYETSPESRVKGRININTAPEFVLQRLPWLDVKLRQEDGNILDTNEVAADIVEGREDHAYQSIGDMLALDQFMLFGRDDTNNARKDDPNDPNHLDELSTYYQPDETWDEKTDDFEEELQLLSLVSNQVTVRSDVFSVYLLIRLGRTGPQRRCLAILDRSEVDSLDDQVKVLALVKVPDPR